MDCLLVENPIKGFPMDLHCKSIKCNKRSPAFSSFKEKNAGLFIVSISILNCHTIHQKSFLERNKFSSSSFTHGEPGGPFAGTGWPYIVDFAVLERVRGRGVGSALMDAVEALAAVTSDTVCLGVGLHSGYGAAQRMYVLRGYVPDGSVV